MEPNVKELTVVKTLTNTLRQIAALPPDQWPEPWFQKLRRGDDEKASDYRERALEVIGDRWGRTASSVRSMEDGYRQGRDCGGFLDDLHKYGGVQFNKKTGALIKSTLNKGTSPSDYLRLLAARTSAARSRARA